MAQDTSLQEDGGRITLSAKQAAPLLIAIISILVAAGSGLGYLILDHLLSDNGQRIQGFNHEQFDDRFEQHRVRVFETCRASREAVELQLDSLQTQVIDLSRWIDKIQKEDTKIAENLQSHLSEYNTHVIWGRERLIKAETEKSEAEKKIERHDAQIKEIYRLLQRTYSRRE